ncbi:MAG: acetyltransferase [Mariprofundaceae bacterium]|nr:acetyltransferase [Mariprofundaceae bacterium]
MADFDIFNGDADGVCALHQLRLAEPREACLMTGVKRDISLLCRLDAAAGDRVAVLDISLDKNRAPLLNALERGAQVEYFDHHYAGDIPQHPSLQAHIDTSPDICTSLLVSNHLEGRYLAWAVTAAFGDNLHAAARAAAAPLDLDAAQLDRLCTLGECLNYNGYGVTEDDLFFHPAELYRRVRPYADPFDFILQDDAFGILESGMNGDLEQARNVKPENVSDYAALFLLPNMPWARRVSGVYGNELARDYPERAHAVAMQLDDGCWRISVRAPLSSKEGADTLCRAFPTGGGRAGAAGINQLPAAMLDEFVAALQQGFRTHQ